MTRTSNIFQNISCQDLSLLITTKEKVIKTKYVVGTIEMPQAAGLGTPECT